MADCLGCGLPVWFASTPEAFDPSKHCLARSGAVHQVQACKARQFERLKVQAAAALSVVAAADVLRQRLKFPLVGVGLTERRRELLAYDAVREALRKVMG